MQNASRNPNFQKREYLEHPRKEDSAVKATGEPGAKEKKKGICGKFCPKCGSTDVFWASGLPQLWSLWQCRNCHYRGPVILEDGDLALKLQEQWKRENH